MQPPSPPSRGPEISSDEETRVVDALTGLTSQQPLRRVFGKTVRGKIPSVPGERVFFEAKFLGSPSRATVLPRAGESPEGRGNEAGQAAKPSRSARSGSGGRKRKQSRSSPRVGGQSGRSPPGILSRADSEDWTALRERGPPGVESPADFSAILAGRGQPRGGSLVPTPAPEPEDEKSEAEVEEKENEEEDVERTEPTSEEKTFRCGWEVDR